MDGYSRLIAWLKVFLPLMALGLLSTLFLLSRDRAPVAAIPFADADIASRLRDQQLSGALYAGTTAGGGRISVSAGEVLTAGGKPGENRAKDFYAQFDSQSGTRITVKSQEGTFSLQAGTADLERDVVVTTSAGYRLLSEFLTLSLDGIDVESPGPVSGSGPFGRLEAGAMHLSEPDGPGHVQLNFTNGVNLIYEPENER